MMLTIGDKVVVTLMDGERFIAKFLGEVPDEVLSFPEWYKFELVNSVVYVPVYSIASIMYSKKLQSKQE